MNYILINNQFIDEAEAKISVKERGFRFGDGVFETCLIFDRIIYNWPNHLKRLKQGLESIKINYDPSDLQLKAIELIKKNQLNDGILRISISRGVGSRGYMPAKNITPLLVIETANPNMKITPPINLWISQYQKPSLQALPVNYKLMQGLNSTLAKMEAYENNCFDSILLNEKGEICETSSANIFLVKDNILYTPDEDCGILLGTTRAKIIELSPIAVKLAKINIASLEDFDEIFITNVALGVLAVDNVHSIKKSFSNKNYSQIFAELLELDIKSYAKRARMD